MTGVHILRKLIVDNILLMFGCLPACLPARKDMPCTAQEFGSNFVRHHSYCIEMICRALETEIQHLMVLPSAAPLLPVHVHLFILIFGFFYI